MNDNELNELNQEVLKRTNWDDICDYYKTVDRNNVVTEVRYTSDYILEKLKPVGNVVLGWLDDCWNAGIEYTEFLEGDKELPLKALLKLVIALDDAGELK